MLIASELGKMASELKSGVADLGMKWEDYLLHIKKSETDLKKDWRDEAQNRVRAALALREIAREERINPTEEEVKERADQFLRQFDPVRGESRRYVGTDDASAHRTSDGIDPAELHDYAQGVLRNEKVFELLENMG